MKKKQLKYQRKLNPLKPEVDKLKQENIEKINILAKIHFKEIESLKSENLVLRNKMNREMELSNLKDKEILKAKTKKPKRKGLAGKESEVF